MMSACSNCGFSAHVEHGGEFCSQCGTKLTKNVTDARDVCPPERARAFEELKKARAEFIRMGGKIS